MKLANSFHKLLNLIDNYFFSGFLGEMPNAIWSSLYTSWLKLAGAKIGKGSKVHHSVKVWFPENISIGREVRIPASTDMAGMGRISIGDFVLIGANVDFITNHHPVGNEKLEQSEILRGTQSSISVGNNVWIMNGAKLVGGKKGLSIGDHSWIATGAVVVKDIHPHQLWGGIPAQRIKDLQ